MRCAALLLGALLLIPGARAQPTAVDSAGRTVRLEQPAQRIVALAPHIVENVFSAGAGDRLVGVVDYSDYPEAARRIPRVGNFQSWSPEAIVALRPDLVLLWGSGNGAARLAQLEQLGIPVYVSELRKLQDVPASIRAIAALAGTSATGEASAQHIEQSFAQLRAQYARREPVSVFYQIWNEPLQTVNGEHMISQVIELCGGRNVFADAPSLAPRVSLEALLARNPDAIVASGMDEARPEWLDEWRSWEGLKAVQGDALFYVPPDHLQRPTARLLLGAGELCRQLAQLRRGD